FKRALLIFFPSVKSLMASSMTSANTKFPIVSLTIDNETIGNLVLAEVIDEAIKDLTEGKNMSNALLKSELFPKMAMQMIKVGEETGKLEEMLLKMAEIYDKQLKTTIKRMLALLEPLLIVVLGLMVSGIIAAILLAVLSVNDLAF
ncbi:MAG: type II secretion system F family protein, partial [Methylococcales bacterium]|nr:type II secretion system F family protein [Methylococcales bacterium]